MSQRRSGDAHSTSRRPSAKSVVVTRPPAFAGKVVAPLPSWLDVDEPPPPPSLLDDASSGSAGVLTPTAFWEAHAAAACLDPAAELFALALSVALPLKSQL